MTFCELRENSWKLLTPGYVLQLLFNINHKIAKNTTTKAREKISTDFESLEFYQKIIYVWLTLKTIKFYWIKLVTDLYLQPSYLLGERASLSNALVHGA